MSFNTVNVRNAFSSSKGSTRAYADATGTVRVWDSVARHYTVCHSLTAGQIDRVRTETQPTIRFVRIGSAEVGQRFGSVGIVTTLRGRRLWTGEVVRPLGFSAADEDARAAAVAVGWVVVD